MLLVFGEKARGMFFIGNLSPATKWIKNDPDRVGEHMAIRKNIPTKNSGRVAEDLGAVPRYAEYEYRVSESKKIFVLPSGSARLFFVSHLFGSSFRRTVRMTMVGIFIIIPV
jgi:hypothetical protein